MDVFREEVKNFTLGRYQPSGFPFPDDLVLTAVIGSTILWVIREYGPEVVGWEKNFVLTCSCSCETAETIEEFNIRKKAYAKAIRSWKTGRYLKYLNPRFIRSDGVVHTFQGLHRGKFYVNSDINEAKTPAEAFDAVQCMMPSVGFVLSQLEPLKKAA